MEPNPGAPKPPHNLDDIEKGLYKPNAEPKPNRVDGLRQKRFAVRTDWAQKIVPETNPLEKLPPSFFKKFFYYALGFLGFALVFAVIMFFTGGNTVSNNQIEINILGNTFASGGEELPLQAEIVNKNAGALELADLFVEYDKGGDTTGGAGHVRDDYSLGTIDAGKTVTKHILVTLYGEQGSTKNVTFTLQYRLHGSNAIFVKTNTFTVTINSAPVSLAVDAPQNLTPNQDLTFTVKVKSNTDKPLTGMLLHVDYPTGFNYKSANPAPTSFTNTWDLGDLAPGAERDIAVTGTVYGSDGEDRAFHIYTGAKSASDATKIGVTYNSTLMNISLVKPFLGAHISINGSNDLSVPVRSGQVDVAVTYTNNLPSSINNAVVTLALSGNALDTSKIIAPTGFYDSAKNQIVWDSTSDPNLGEIQPGGQGVLQATLATKPLVSGGTTLTSPSIKLSVSIKGKQPDQGGAVTEVTDFEERTAVVSTDLGFTVAAHYASGPFTNTGPIPPKANEPTTYTITWSATNSANSLGNATAVSTLPTYVDWVGPISPSSEQVTYDPTTRKVTWNIGQIPAGAGISGPARAVSFQVRFNASTSQVGAIPQLILDTNVSARDSFTGDTLSVTRIGVTTLLQDDPGFPPLGGSVVN